MEQSEELFALASKYGLPFFLALAISFRGWALTEQGQIAEGIAEMRQAITDLQNAGVSARTIELARWPNATLASETLRMAKRS
jgi:hypothetical protein